MNPSAARIEALFSASFALPVTERRAFLEKTCADDADLRMQVESLLAAYDQAPGYLDESPADRFAGGAEEMPGDRIGRYQLIQKIGEGGCGVVYLAAQEEPVRRRVALKVIKAGMDTHDVIARFGAEQQALALMDHPGIAKVFDAGATATGRPFFVMELVRGIPITAYCDEHRLPPTARLELFIEVCHAVQHAHQKGIIHRDLKPSNILVALDESTARPKVIDFGIAKATQGRLTDAALVTAFEQFIGTPTYMSPEQADMNVLDVDTRADVYALGVLLYELLIGRLPFDPQSLAQASREEIRRIIREVEPPKPSQQLSLLGDAERAATANLRHTDPAKLSLLLSRDLDWIVMKALEKNRAHRYESAAAFAADVTRHLNHEPVVARPPSKLYRFGRTVRRHRLLCAAAAAVTFALAAGTVISTWQAARARRAEQLAGAERHRVMQAQTRADELIAFMLGDLRTPLAKAGQLGLLDAVAGKAMEYFASLDPRDFDDRTLSKQVTALTQLGGLRMDQARYAEAEQVYAAAYARAVALTRNQPQVGEALFARGQAEWGNGFVRLKRGEFDAAREWFVRYRDTSAALAALDPANPAWQRELASGHHNLAALEADHGRPDVARQSFQDELATLAQLLVATPADLPLQAQIADVTSFLGSLAERMGDLAEATQRFGNQLARLEAIGNAEPQAPHWRFKLAEASVLLAGVNAVSGRPAAARIKLAHARELLDPLVTQDGTNRRWRHARLVVDLKEAELAKAAFDTARAVTLAAAAREGFERLVAQEPSDRRFQARLAAAWRLEAELRQATNRTDAGTAAARAVELGETLVRQGRATPAEIAECAQAGITAGRMAAARGDADAARRQWERARGLLAPLLAGTKDWRLLDPAARAAALLGRPQEAQAAISQLTDLGYVPLEPWPESGSLVIRK